jgi:hypothetical protein
MSNNWHLFTTEQGNWLIRLLLAHILSEFVLKTKAMRDNKTLLSKSMLGHISIVFVLTLLLSCSWKIAMIVAITHWLIDSLKQFYQNSNSLNTYTLFIIDQILHILIIISLWGYKFQLICEFYNTVNLFITDYKFSLLALGYAGVVWPLGYVIKFALHKMVPQTNTENIEQGGKLIGQFERIIILTFVLLGEYEAIGFLITGKSIIRFADKNPEVKSEYVLVGTMMSYALSILSGLIIKSLL